MQVREIMTPHAEYIGPKTTLIQAARKMVDLDCGFLPIADSAGAKLKGVLTDRDIVVRAVAEGKSMTNTPADEIKSERVLYCFEDDSVEEAASSMEECQVYRLVVLDNRESKKLTGIITLGDISRSGEKDLVGKTAPEVAES
ncbi:MAG: CBS domain-containing protein [Xanthomonadales bacterium]|nr:CBS domain-containing protein [Xanthomonadales bacterium]